MREELVIKAHAKLNLALDVVARRPDGYHDLDMLMVSVSVADTVTLTPLAGGEIVLRGDMPARSAEDNLCLRAARLYRETFGVTEGMAITLKKQIPVCAGMGGGSADAAACLGGMERWYGLAGGKLSGLALSLGADVPFMLRGGLCRAQGVGERLTPYPAPGLFFAGVMPAFGASTKDIFSRFSLAKKENVPDIEGCLAALAAQNAAACAPHMANVLQPVTFALQPRMLSVLHDIESTRPLKAMMTGSGSFLFGLYPTKAAAAAAAGKLRQKHARVLAMQSVPFGLGLMKGKT